MNGATWTAKGIAEAKAHLKCDSPTGKTSQEKKEILEKLERSLKLKRAVTVVMRIGYYKEITGRVVGVDADEGYFLIWKCELMDWRINIHSVGEIRES